MELNITCIPGDGIGPEIVGEAKKVLEKVAAVYGHKMNFTDILMGGASIDVHGVPLTDEAIATAKAADAVLMGSIGGDDHHEGPLGGSAADDQPPPRPGTDCLRRGGLRRGSSESGRP